MIIDCYNSAIIRVREIWNGVDKLSRFSNETSREFNIRRNGMMRNKKGQRKNKNVTKIQNS